ncbi:hypothetical protein HDV00_011967 [Rhizophlyctis rosea]|nr:hypothetical protein HDV00_011967 [Rhizophlyctis rosea]
MSTPQTDPAAVGHLLNVVNFGAQSVLLSIGYRLGLFDILKRNGPATSQKLAEEAKYNERYVREWLNGLVSSQMVVYTPSTQTYHLHPSYAPIISRFALSAQFSVMSAQQEERIMRCFKEGGGVSYGQFGQRFHDAMCEMSSANLLPFIIPEILPNIGEEMMQRLRDGIDILEIGCGAGRPTKLLAQEFPNSRFTGIDICQEAIDMANAGLEGENLPNVTYKVEDNCKLPPTAQYDLILVFDAIHDQADPTTALRKIHDALRPNGTFLMQDIGGNSSPEQNIANPLGSWLYTVSLCHCMTVSLAEGGAGLGTMWGKQLARSMLTEAGFGNIKEFARKDDFVNVVFVCRK